MTRLLTWMRRILNLILGRPPTEHHNQSVDPLVRAFPRTVSLVEAYEYEQTISRNPAGPDERCRSGVIEVLTPLDGHRHFGRAAVADVAKALSARAAGLASAGTGHLLLSNHRDSTFPVEAALDEQYGSIPLHVVLDGVEIGGLRSPDDRTRHRTQIRYLPPEISQAPPIEVEVDISDPDNSNLPAGRIRPVDLTEEVADEVSKYIAFDSNLVVSISVVVTLPSAPTPPGSVRLDHLSLDWPTITSLDESALRLRVDGQPWEILHNPARRTLEWGGVPLKEHLDGRVAGLDRFTTSPMRLFVEKPGELYEQERLECHVDMVVADRLISGLDARVFDARGFRLRRTPDRRSHLRSTVRTELGEAFADRLLSTFLHLHFEEIVPKEVRIADLKTALHDLGFAIKHEKHLATSDQSIRRAVLAERQEGPDRLALVLVVRGLKHKTERQSERDGVRYTTELDSGEIQLSVRGALPGDSGQIIAEMNRLQLALRERFERVRDQR